MGFVIHWHESAMELHVFPIPITPPTSLSTRFLGLGALVTFVWGLPLALLFLESLFIAIVDSQLHLVGICGLSLSFSRLESLTRQRFPLCRHGGYRPKTAPWPQEVKSFLERCPEGEAQKSGKLQEKYFQLTGGNVFRGVFEASWRRWQITINQTTSIAHCLGPAFF